MADRSLRIHERAAATGDPDAEAPLLRAQVRAGTLSQVRLRLAAYCGDDAARSAADWTAGGNGRVYYVNDLGCSVGRVDVLMLGKMGPTAATDWLTGLRSVASGLDTGKREERCGCFNGSVERKAWDPKWTHIGCLEECPRCDGTGIRLFPRDGGSWVTVQAAIAAGWLACEAWCRETCGGQYIHECPEIREALKATQRYQDEPTLAALAAWEQAFSAGAWGQQGSMIWWIPEPNGDRNTEIQAAARAVGGPCPGCESCRVGLAVVKPDRCDGTGRIPDEAAVRETICADLIEWALA